MYAKFDEVIIKTLEDVKRCDSHSFTLDSLSELAALCRARGMLTHPESVLGGVSSKK